MPLFAAVAAAIGWIFLPGSVPDRALFQLVALGQANPPFFIAGQGSDTEPWQLRTVSAAPRPDPASAPLIVSLGDDTGGFFQTSPPSPIDVAVILRNFQRLGVDKAATAAVLAWDSPDPIGLAALENVLARFDSLVMAAPLTRGAEADPLPAAFRNASLPASHVHGNLTDLPVVNRVSLTGVILGRENTLAGFQSIDFETVSRYPHLLARWDERIVLAFPLLVALQRLDVPIHDLEIRLGEYLKLGPEGPVVPLDRFGRMTSAVGGVSPYAEIPAEALIDGDDALFPKQAPQPVILRDDRSAAEPHTKRFSREFPTTIATIASDAGLAPTRSFVRLTCCQDIVLLAVLIAALATVSRLPSFARQTSHVAVAAFWIAAHLITASHGVWLPLLSALSAIAAASLLSGIRWFDPIRNPE
jgi:hypothetical protein